MTPHQRKIKAIVANLLDWYPKNARDLPWRRTSDPYGVFVSEIMLQQTQVQTVLPYWQRWMKALPDIRSLAQASPEKIHKLWEGLGYYTRVRNLQKAAQIILHEHGGRFPECYEQVLALPGVGRYTAGAICSIAFNQPAPILDGNVMRVLARLYAIEGNPRDKATNAQFWQLAEELVQAAAPRNCSHLNQSLMELGALVCTPKQPRCLLCPVAELCQARRQNRVEELPHAAPRPSPTARRFAAFVLSHKARFLVQQRPAGIVNAHLWEFPNIELPVSANGALSNKTAALSEKALQAAAHQVLGFKPTSLETLCTIKHSITRYRITLEAFRVLSSPDIPATDLPSSIVSTTRWLSLRDLAQLPFTSAHKKILSLLSD